MGCAEEDSESASGVDDQLREEPAVQDDSDFVKCRFSFCTLENVLEDSSWDSWSKQSRVSQKEVDVYHVITGTWL